MPINNPVAFYDQAVKYTAVVPRILELNNVAVPTGGQVYQLTGVPSDRPIVAAVQLWGGVASNGTVLSIVCEGVAAGGQSIPAASGFGDIGDTTSYYDVNTGALFAQKSTLLIPCNSGQIYLRRAGNYNIPSQQTSLWAVGYWEGMSL